MPHEGKNEEQGSGKRAEPLFKNWAAILVFVIVIIVASFVLRAVKHPHKATLSELSEKIKAAPHNANLHRVRGNRFFEAGDFTAAEADYTAAIDLRPNDLNQLLVLRARASNMRGNPGKSLKDANESIKLNPNFSLAWVEKAEAEVNLGKYEEVIPSAEKALELATTDESGLASSNKVRAHFCKGRAYKELRQLDLAEQSWRDCLLENPNYVVAHSGLAQIYLYKGQLEKALAEANMALETGSNSKFDYQAWWTRGLIYEALRKYDLALSDLDRAAKISPSSIGIQADRDRILRVSGQSEDSEKKILQLK